MRLPVQSTLATWPNPSGFNPVTRGSENSIITSALLPMTLMVMVLRVRIRLQTSCWRLDDSLIIASLVPTVGYAILGLMWDYQTGWKHLWDYPAGELMIGLQVTLVSQILFTAASTLMKLSILMFIRRKLSKSNALTKIILTTITIAIAAQGVAFMCLTLFQCSETSDYWELSYQPQSCLRESQLLLASGITNVLATPLMFTFFLSFNERLTTFVLLFGCMVVILAGATRSYFQVSAVESWDILWNIYPAWIAGSVELHFGTICASIPLLKPLLQSVFCCDPRTKLMDLESKKGDYGSTLAIHHEKFPERHFEVFPTSHEELPLATPPGTYQRSQNQMLHSYPSSDFSDISDTGNSLGLRGYSNESYCYRIPEIPTFSVTLLSIISEESPEISTDITRANIEHRSSVFTFGALPFTSKLGHIESKTSDTKQTSENKRADINSFYESCSSHCKSPIQSCASSTSSCRSSGFYNRP
ncbi:hypothetical protein K3495_g2608 [Podosphaera aphanis]|nr:hypothetical protein K3495_g2608 [Podosphaera aphanis]